MTDAQIDHALFSLALRVARASVLGAIVYLLRGAQAYLPLASRWELVTAIGLLGGMNIGTRLIQGFLAVLVAMVLFPPDILNSLGA